MDSWKDKVKATIYSELWKRDEFQEEDTLNKLKAVIADAVFDALGIVEDEQDLVGGYFMLRGAVKGNINAVELPPKWRKFKEALGACSYFTTEEAVQIYFTCADTSLDAVLNSCKLLNIGLSDMMIVELRKVL